jgi:hypothetical protein
MFLLPNPSGAAITLKDKHTQAHTTHITHIQYTGIAVLWQGLHSGLLHSGYCVLLAGGMCILGCVSF